MNTVNGLCLALTFWMSRLPLQPFLLWHWSHDWAGLREIIPPLLFWFVQGVAVVITTLNYTWAYKIARGLLLIVFPRKKAKSQ
jgi:hypothetical protein